MFGRQLRTRLDLVKPNVEQRVEEKQAKQKERHDKRAKPHAFQVDNKVFVKNTLGNRRWIPVTVTAVTGLVSYHVKLDSGRVRKCHRDQLHSRETVSENLDSLECESMDLSIPLPSTDESDDDDQSSNMNDAESNLNTETRRIYPSCTRSQPDRYI